MMTEREFEQRLGALVDQALAARYGDPTMGSWLSKGLRRLRRGVGRVLTKVREKVVDHTKWVLRKALPVVSTVASFVPGIGTAVAIGLSAVNTAVQLRDAQVAKKRAENQYKAEAAEYNKIVETQKAQVAKARQEVNQIAQQAMASGDPAAIQFAKEKDAQVAEAEAQLGVTAQRAQFAEAQAAQAGQDAAKLQAQYEAAKYTAKVTSEGGALANQTVTPEMLQRQLVLDTLKSQGIDPNSAEAKSFADRYIEAVNARQNVLNTLQQQGVDPNSDEAQAFANQYANNLVTQPAQPMSGFSNTASTPNWLMPVLGIGALYMLAKPSRRKRR